MRRLSSLRGSKPSPSMIVAMIALFVALGGTAAAGGLFITGANIVNGTVTTQDIKNNNLRGRDVRNGSLTGFDIANNSVRGRDIRDGDLTEQDFAEGVLGGAYWAVVTADAQLDRGKGATSVTRVDGVPTGAYLVQFDKPIADCAWTATAASAPEALTPIFGSFSILMNLQGSNAVGVFVFQNSATPALQDTPFHLAVHCGADEQEDESNGSSNGPPSN